jgi:MarC family membrane protein
MEFLSAALLLFFVIDPIGAIPIFLGTLRNVPEHRRPAIILRECVIGFGVLVLFMFFGKLFLEALHLSETSLGIAGGIILFLIAIRMVFPTSEHLFGEAPEGEPLLFPLAIPTIAGPSALATIILLVSKNPSQFWIYAGALTAALAVSTIILLLAGRIANIIGPRVMTAAERLMGLILTAVAVEMFLQGVRTFVVSLHAPHGL